MFLWLRSLPAFWLDFAFIGLSKTIPSIWPSSCFEVWLLFLVGWIRFPRRQFYLSGRQGLHPPLITLHSFRRTLARRRHRHARIAAWMNPTKRRLEFMPFMYIMWPRLSCNTCKNINPIGWFNTVWTVGSDSSPTVRRSFNFRPRRVLTVDASGTWACIS